MEINVQKFVEMLKTQGIPPKSQLKRGCCSKAHLWGAFFKSVPTDNKTLPQQVVHYFNSKKEAEEFSNSVMTEYNKPDITPQS